MLEKPIIASIAVWAWLTAFTAHVWGTVLSNMQERLFPNAKDVNERRLLLELRDAKRYEAWIEKARELDLLTGNESWKNDPSSPYYDYKLIVYRLRYIRSGQADLPSQVSFIRSGLSRNLGGCTDVRLFKRCYIGTKKLVEEYNENMVGLLWDLAKRDFDDGVMTNKRKFFEDTRRGFGRSALVLQGGATFGLSHLGVCKSLFENGLLPTIMCGSAIGALIAALVCTHTDSELPTVFSHGGIDISAFENKSSSGNLRRKLTRLLRQGYLLDVKVIEDCVRKNIGDTTFEEAHLRTGRILNITVSPARKHEVPQLLNYLTAPNVLIWSAACASAATFGLYKSVNLLAKDHEGKIVNWSSAEILWSEATDDNDLGNPVNRLSELFTVNHLIVSEANAYIASLFQQWSRSPVDPWQRKTLQFFVSEFTSVLRFLVPQLFTGVLDDRFHGNVTILPSFQFKDGRIMFSNPTKEVLDYWMLKGEQSTWPKLSLIKNRCLIEFALDSILKQLPGKPSYPEMFHALHESAGRSGAASPAKQRAKSIN